MACNNASGLPGRKRHCTAVALDDKQRFGTLLLLRRATKWLVAALVSNNVRALPCRKCHCTVEAFDDKQRFVTPLLHPKGDDEAQNVAGMASVRAHRRGTNRQVTLWKKQVQDRLKLMGGDVLVPPLLSYSWRGDELIYTHDTFIHALDQPYSTQ